MMLSILLVQLMLAQVHAPKAMIQRAAEPFTLVPIAAIALADGHPKFQAVALDLPHVYVVDLTGGVYDFVIDPQLGGQTLQGQPALASGAEGADIKLVDGNVFLAKKGSLRRFSVGEHPRFTAAGEFGDQEKWASCSIVTDGSRGFLLNERSVSSWSGFERLGMPRELACLEGDAIWFTGCVAGEFLCASVVQVTDEATAIVIYEIGEAGALKQRGKLPMSGWVFGVHMLSDGRLLLVGDRRDHRLTIANIEDPDAPRVSEIFSFPSTRSSVLASIHGKDVLVTGKAGAVFGDVEPVQILYPYDTAGSLDVACYPGDVQGEYCALASDRTVHVVRIVSAEQR